MEGTLYIREEARKLNEARKPNKGSIIIKREMRDRFHVTHIKIPSPTPICYMILSPQSISQMTINSGLWIIRNEKLCVRNTY